MGVRLNQISALIALSSVMTVLGCASGAVFSRGSQETKPQTQVAPSLQRQDGDASPAKPILSAKYIVSVDASNGMNLCKGEANVTIASDMNFQPTGKLECVIVGEKDISEFFNEPPTVEFDPKQYPEFGRITRKGNPQPGFEGPSFDPPKPNLIGPLIQNPDDFANYRYKEESTVTVSTEQGPVTDTGSFFVQVFSVRDTLTPAGFAKTYDDVIHWEISTSGFARAPKSALKLHERFEWWWNVRPISIPQMKIHTTLSRLFDGGLSSLGEAFLGKVTISITIADENRF